MIATISTVGGRIDPRSATNAPGKPPAAYPTNMASCRASLPGRTLEKANRLHELALRQQLSDRLLIQQSNGGRAGCREQVDLDEGQKT